MEDEGGEDHTDCDWDSGNCFCLSEEPSERARRISRDGCNAEDSITRIRKDPEEDLSNLMRLVVAQWRELPYFQFLHLLYFERRNDIKTIINK